MQTALKERGVDVQSASIDFIPKSFVVPGCGDGAAAVADVRRSENLGMLRKAMEQLEERPDTVRITVNVERHVLEDEGE